MKISFEGKLSTVLYCLGNGYIHHRPLPFVPATTVLDGSKMANTYPANAFAQSTNPFPHIGMFARRMGVICRVILFFYNFPLKTAFLTASKTASTLNRKNLKTQLYFYG